MVDVSHWKFSRGTSQSKGSAPSRFVQRRRARAAVGEDAGDQPGTSRRSFLRSSGGYATGVAAVVGIPGAVLLEANAEAAAPVAKVVSDPKTPAPEGPVMAYVHDAKKGTVVIMTGTTQRTVQDHELVHRLLTVPKKPRKAKRKHRRSVKATSVTGA